MISEQLDVFQHALNDLQQNLRVALISVVKTWGSSPRPVGSLLAVNNAGGFCGSVSGGCVEDDLLAQLQQNFPIQTTLVRYGETSEEQLRYRLPCGGTLDLLIEPLTDVAEVQTIVTALEQRQLMHRITELPSGETHLSPQVDADPQPLFDTDADGNPLRWRNTLGPGWRLFLTGAGTISQYLGEMATALGFDVIVSDPRPEYRNQWQSCWGRLVDGYPDDALREIQADARTAVIGLTHDPKLDDLALIEAIQSEAFYIGAMGSMQTSRNRLARLETHFEFTPSDLQRIKGPVGIHIGSKTPPEIALSVLAEVTAFKNGVSLD